MDAPTVRYARAPDGAAIAYAVHGQGPPLLLCRSWGHLEAEWQIEEMRTWFELLGTTFAVIRYDLRGSGMSDRVAVDVEHAGLDAGAVLEDAGVGEVDFFGMGLGYTPESLVTLYQLGDRIRRAILWCPDLQGAPPVVRALQSVAQFDDDLYFDTIMLWYGWQHPESRRAMIELRRISGLKDQSPGLYERVDERTNRATEVLPHITVPTLVLAKRDSVVVPHSEVDSVARQLPHASRRNMSGRSAYPCLDDQQELLAVMREFLQPAVAEAPTDEQRSPQVGTTIATERSTPSTRQKGESPPIQYVRRTDGVNIAYWVAGSGLPIVALHSGPHSHIGREWDIPAASAAYERVAERCALVRMDFRNSGLSSRGVEALSLDDYLGDLEAVIARLPEGPLVLLGHAEKAAAAARYAVHHPERVAGIIFTQAVFSWPQFPPREAQAFDTIAPLASSDWKLYTDLSSVIGVGLDDHELAAQWAQFIRAAIAPDDYRRVIRAALQQDVLDLLPKIEAPALILHGTGPAFSFDASQEAASLLPNASLLSLKSRLTWWWEEEGVEAILRFVDEVRAASHSRASPVPARGPGGSGSSFRTILFTDVVSSTPLLAQLKDVRMREVMRNHDEVLDAAVTRHGGRVIKTIGDAFMAEFAVPSNAVDAAIAAQRDLRERFGDSDVPVRIRIGINAGEPIEEDGDLHGASVVIAKRLESAADINGILVSDVVKQAVAGKDFAFEDRGEVVLKGFEEPVRAWAVRWS